MSPILVPFCFSQSVPLQLSLPILISLDLIPFCSLWLTLLWRPFLVSLPSQFLEEDSNALKWNTDKRLKTLRYFYLVSAFFYNLEGPTTWVLFSQNYSGLQTDESITCMLNVAVLDWVATHIPEMRVGVCDTACCFFSALIVSSETLTLPWVLTHPRSRWWFCFGLIP